MRYSNLSLLVVLLALFIVGAALSFAQDAAPPETAPSTCEATLEGLWALASDACATGPPGYVCNGGSAPQVRPSGPVANSLAPVGALVETDVIEAVQTLPIITQVVGGGVMWFRWGEPHYTTGLIVGEVVLFNTTPEGATPWSSMVVQTGMDRPDCPTTPHNTFLLEPQPNILSTMTVNGVTLEITGVIAVRTIGETTVFAALSGKNIATVQGIDYPIWTGQQIAVGYAPGNFAQPTSVIQEPAPLDPLIIEFFPTGLLDQPVWLPQPGYATTEGLVNLRSEPSLEGLLLGQVPAGELLTVIGTNPAGDWLHVSVSGGYSGWMFAELLNQNQVQVSRIYEATPQPPQRYGSLNNLARVRAPAGLNVRENPATGFPAVGSLNNEDQVMMLARSPYGPWVKVADMQGNVLGWVAVLGLDTRANIGALPVDGDVPPPPPDVPQIPTPPPGSFGNAFPDPRGGRSF